MEASVYYSGLSAVAPALCIGNIKNVDVDPYVMCKVYFGAEIELFISLPRTDPGHHLAPSPPRLRHSRKIHDQQNNLPRCEATRGSASASLQTGVLSPPRAAAARRPAAGDGVALLEARLKILPEN